MVYYEMKKYKIAGFRKSNRANKKYDALLESKKDGQIYIVPFGDSRYKMYQDKTGLNEYQHLIHSDKKRRASYRSRHKGFLKDGYYSPGYFAYHYLW